MNQKELFKDKQERVLKRIIVNMQGQGVDTQQHMAKLRELARGFMLVEQCLWVRLETSEKIDKMLKTFEDVMPSTLALIAREDFESLVYTYRANYTNLYTYKQEGVKRWYKLSKKDYQEYLERLEKGSLKVVAKPKAKTTTKKASQGNIKKKNAPTRKAQDDQAQPSQLVQMALAIETSDQAPTTTTKKATTKKATTKTTTKKASQGDIKKKNAHTQKDTKTIEVIHHLMALHGLTLEDLAPQKREAQAPKTPKPKRKKKGAWSQIKLDELAKSTFIKVKMQEGKTRFVRFKDTRQDDATTYLLVNDHGLVCEIDTREIAHDEHGSAMVYEYIKNDA